MARGDATKIHMAAFSLRWIQGYRYLDRAGEALIRLENSLHPHWITADISPQRGVLKNQTLGMQMTFDSSQFTFQQTHFISFDHFRDQLCRSFEVLWSLFEIKRIHLPAIQLVFQRGFDRDRIDDAMKKFRDLPFCRISPELNDFMGGNHEALDFAYTTSSEATCGEQPVTQRRRIASTVIQQQEQVSGEDLLNRRIKSLRLNEQDQARSMFEARKALPPVFPVAIQFSLETALESELAIDDFPLADFLEYNWKWAESFPEFLSRQQPLKS